MIIEIGWQIPKEAITKDWEGYLWQILLFPAATVCSSARNKADHTGRVGAAGFHPELFGYIITLANRQPLYLVHSLNGLAYWKQ